MNVEEMEKEIAALRTEIEALKEFVRVLYSMIMEDEEEYADDGPWTRYNT